MLYENAKVIVNIKSEKEKGIVLNIQNETAFIKLDVDGTVLPFGINELELSESNV